jgi:peptide/nickel transport system substrate-binding protein
VVDWVQGDHITLARFDDYYGARPDWDEVTYRAIVNDAARTAALLSGDVDLIAAVPGNDLANVRDNPALVVSTMQSNRCFFWTVDVDRDVSPLVTDADGKPMSEALDRDALVSRVMLGQGVPASQFMPDGVPGTSAAMKAELFDLDGAKKLLAEAGYPSGFGLTVASTNDRYVNDAAITRAVAQMWTRLGLKMTVSTLPKAVYFPRAVKLEFSVLLSGNSTDTSEPLSQLTYLLGTFDASKGIGAGNYGRYSSPALDKLLAAASVTLDDGKRAALIAQSYELALGQDVAAIPMLFQITAWGMRKGITYGGFPQDATVAAVVHMVE